MFELLSETLVDAGFAAVAGLGFAYASSPPKRTLIFCALLAAFAHASFYERNFRHALCQTAKGAS